MNTTYVLGDNLYINLTNQCPNACEFCVRTHGDGVGDADSLWLEREPSREEVWEEIQSRELTKYRQLVFCGYGEPTCRFDDMMWLCRKLREHSSIDIRINTNGLSDLINGRRTAPEMDGLVDVVSVSLNASTPEKYDAICHSKYGLDALPAILKFTTDAGFYVPNVSMTIVDNGLPPEEIEACRELCRHTGAKFRVRPYIDTY